MKTRLRLLLTFIIFAGCFALSWYLFVYKQPQQQLPPKVKTTEELLVGIWEIVEQEPPMPSDCKAEYEIVTGGKFILKITNPRGNLSPFPGTYQLQGEHISLNHLGDEHNKPETWNAYIETITDDTLVLVGTGEKSRTAKVVCRRNRESNARTQ